MTRLLTPLLLILSLIGNGLLAPWAMAAMLPLQPLTATTADQGHGCHSEAASEQPSVAFAQGPTEPITDRLATDPHIEMLAQDLGQAPACCDGESCHCGCILPSLLAQYSGGLDFAPAAAAPKVALRKLHSLAIGHPPFRPPAA